LSACFCLSALCGVVVLPWKAFLVSAHLLGTADTLLMAWFSQADSPWYAAVALDRLVLFALFARTLSYEKTDCFRALFGGVLTGATVACCFGLVAYFLGGGESFSMLDRLTSVFLNPGWFAEFICLAAPLALTPLSSEKRFVRFAAGLALTVMCLSIVLAMSRAGWLVFTMVLSGVLTLGARSGRPKTVLVRAALGLALFGAACGLIFLALGISGVRFGETPLQNELKLRFTYFLSTSRPAVFLSGFLMGMEAPFSGLGYETYAWIHPWLLSQPASFVAKFGLPGKLFETTHNIYIQLFVGGGLPLLATWLLLCWRALYVCLRAGLRENLPLASETALALVAFLAFGLFQEMIYIPAVWLMFFLYLARAAALEREESRGPKRPGGAEVLAMAAVLLATGSIVWGAMSPQGDAPHLGMGTASLRPVGTGCEGGLFEAEIVQNRIVRWSPGVANFLLPGTGPWEMTVGCPALGRSRAALPVEIITGDHELYTMECPEGGWRTVHLSGGDGNGLMVFLRSSLRFSPYSLSARDHRPLSFCVSVPGLTDSLPIIE